jgi:hypothetical protein
MILTNTNPNPVWTAAMGPQGIRFPPGSWDRGGGGYSDYGYMVSAPMLPRWRSAPLPLRGYGDDVVSTTQGGAGVMIMDGGLPPGMVTAPPAGTSGAKILLGISVLAVGLYLFSK